MRDLKGFQGSVEKRTLVSFPKEGVYEALHCLDKWSLYLPHIQKLETIYDDGRYQEFIMHVVSEDNNLLKVRSVRRCNQQDEIEYFQPKPPEFLLHHAGQWKLNAIDENKTELVARHFWNANVERACEYFSVQQSDISSKIEALLGNHALFAMNTWKETLEAGKYQ